MAAVKPECLSYLAQVSPVGHLHTDARGDASGGGQVFRFGSRRI